MKKGIVWILLAILLLSACACGTGGATPTATTVATQTLPQGEKLYPTELDRDFTVICEWMDGIGFLPWMEMSGSFHIITKEPITEADISVQTGQLQWHAALWEEDQYDDALVANALGYGPFLAYRDMDWARMYSILTKSQDDFSEQYNQHLADYRQKTCGWYPEFYCYQVLMSSPRAEGLAVDGVHTETDLTVTVKGSTQVLADICRFSVYEEESIEYPAQSGPLRMASYSGSLNTTYPTAEGYFYHGNSNKLVAKEDLTVTGARFLHAETAEFVAMELCVGDVRMSWDGKTPVDVAAGETVWLRFMARDSAFGNVLLSSAQRLIVIDYTCRGERHTCAYSVLYGFKPDAYECYAIANGRRDALYAQYADYLVKARGWHPDYEPILEGIGNPFWGN